MGRRDGHAAGHVIRARPVLGIVVALCLGLAHAGDAGMFAVYSKGDAEERTLYKVDLSPRGRPLQERKVCEKGKSGGDIEAQISFDGSLVAFSRSLDGTARDYGGNDYHYRQYDIRCGTGCYDHARRQDRSSRLAGAVTRISATMAPGRTYT